MEVTRTHLDVDNKAHSEPNGGVVFTHFCQKGFQVIGVSVVPPSRDARHVLKRVERTFRAQFTRFYPTCGSQVSA